MASHDTCTSGGIARDLANASGPPRWCTMTSQEAINAGSNNLSVIAPSRSAEMLQDDNTTLKMRLSFLPTTSQSPPAILQYRTTALPVTRASD